MKALITFTCVTLLVLQGFSPVCRGQQRDAAGISNDVIEMSIARDPNNHAVRIIAGFHYFDAGDFAHAEENFAWASRLTPDDPYDQAWLYMAQLRQNPKASADAIKAFLKRKENKDFVHTDIHVLLGEITAADAIEKARASGDAGNICEVNYYLAQRLLADGEKMKAREFLANAIKTGKDTFWEWKSAKASLKALE
jgi:lipoprotein NlpI